MMQLITIPAYKPKILKKEQQLWIFDIIRKKYVALKPEEWVRQNFVHYLIENLDYPLNAIGIEQKMMYGKQLKRTDILAYDKNGKPLLLVECKATHIPLDENTLQQGITYNFILQAPWLVLTNGVQGIVLQLKQKQYEPQQYIPTYAEISQDC